MKALFISFFIFISCGAFANSAYTPPTKITLQDIPVIYEDVLSHMDVFQLTGIFFAVLFEYAVQLLAYPLKQLIHLQNSVNVPNIVSDYFFLVHNSDPQKIAKTALFPKESILVINDLSIFHKEHNFIDVKQFIADIQNKYTDEEIDSLYLVTRLPFDSKSYPLISSIKQPSTVYHFISPSLLDNNKGCYFCKKSLPKDPSGSSAP